MACFHCRIFLSCQKSGLKVSYICFILYPLLLAIFATTSMLSRILSVVSRVYRDTCVPNGSRGRRSRRSSSRYLVRHHRRRSVTFCSRNTNIRNVSHCGCARMRSYWSTYLGWGNSLSQYLTFRHQPSRHKSTCNRKSATRNIRVIQ